MKTIIALILLLPCYAMAGDIPEGLRALSRQSAAEATAATSQIRIVRCTQGLYAVQERVPDWRLWRYDDPERFIWRNLSYAPGCYPLEYARMIKQDEIDDRKRPPAPQIIEPVQVVE